MATVPGRSARSVSGSLQQGRERQINEPPFASKTQDSGHRLLSNLRIRADPIEFSGYQQIALPFDQNIRQTRQAIAVLKGINPEILIEGEIGDIGTGSEIHDVAPASQRA
jgi:hypothetical protein